MGLINLITQHSLNPQVPFDIIVLIFLSAINHSIWHFSQRKTSSRVNENSTFRK